MTLRELRADDASALLEHVCTPGVLRYNAPSPTSIEGVKRFIRWTQSQRRQGLRACFGIIPNRERAAVGFIQIWPVESDFTTSEWGFVLSQHYWGTGLFVNSARLLLDFAFGRLGVIRLEARAVDVNNRGNGVLRKLGATREAILRRGFRSGDSFMNHVMWSILADEWAVTRKKLALNECPVS